MARPRILLADDDPTLCQALEAALATFGYTPIVVHDGAAALAVARADPPDLIILDQVMPVMDGLAVLAALQADPRLRPIPVLFLVGTPHAIPLRAGVTGILGKPFRLEVLEEILGAILRSRHPSAPPSDPPPPR